MSHTTYDYITKTPKLWLIHNSDFSGEVDVRWEYEGYTFEWKAQGPELLSGNFKGQQFYMVIDGDKPLRDIPQWVIGRAVATALRSKLTKQVIGFVEGL